MLGTFYPSSGSWLFAESVQLHRGQSQTFLSSNRRCKGPWSQIAARMVQAGCGEAHLPLEQGAALGQVPRKAGSLHPGRGGGVRETPETAHERGTSATPPVREGKASFEMKQSRVSFSLLLLTWLRKQIFLRALQQKPAVCGGVLLDNVVKLEHFSSCFLWGIIRSAVVLLKAVSWSVREAWS